MCTQCIPVNRYTSVIIGKTGRGNYRFQKLSCPGQAGSMGSDLSTRHHYVYYPSEVYK